MSRSRTPNIHKQEFSTVHLQNLRNHHRRFENVSIVRDPIKSKTDFEETEDYQQEFTYRGGDTKRSKSRLKRTRPQHLSPKQKKLIHRCNYKEMVEFEKHQEDRIFQRYVDTKYRNSKKNVELSFKPVVREEKIKMMWRLNKQ
jgi:hypothetical protein